MWHWGNILEGNGDVGWNLFVFLKNSFDTFGFKVGWQMTFIKHTH